MPELFKGLDYFGKLLQNRSLSRLLVYTGDKFQIRTETTVVPWKEFGK